MLVFELTRLAKPCKSKIAAKFIEKLKERGLEFEHLNVHTIDIYFHKPVSAK